MFYGFAYLFFSITPFFSSKFGGKYDRVLTVVRNVLYVYLSFSFTPLTISIRYFPNPFPMIS